MADETYNFTTARTRLEEIVTQVRKKDVSLEASLDLLEEGVRLANQCTELIDHVDWVKPDSTAVGEAASQQAVADSAPDASGDGAEVDGVTDMADDDEVSDAVPDDDEVDVEAGAGPEAASEPVG